MRNNVSTIRFRRSVSKHSGAAANIGGSHYRRASPEISSSGHARSDRPYLDERTAERHSAGGLDHPRGSTRSFSQKLRKERSRSNSASPPRAWPPIIECGTRRRFAPGSSLPTKPDLSTASHYAAARAIRSSTCGCVMSHTDSKKPLK